MAQQTTRRRVAKGCFAGLPYPRNGRLTLYALGPGFGESVVLCMPDGLWMVVDGCTRGGDNLPLALLDAFDQHDVDLLAITHPDEDHIRGLDAVLRDKRVHTVWRYPHGKMVRDFLSCRLERSGPRPERRLATLYQLHEALEDAIKDGEIEVIEGGTDGPAPWIGRTGEYEVTNIAPTSYDAMRMEAQFDELITLRRDDVEASERLLRYLSGSRWSDRPNSVSLALTVTWGQSKILLGGDVEKGTAHGSSGWRGVIRRLTGDGRRCDRRHLLRDLTVVKVAHHGSKGAFEAEAWALHAETTAVELGIVLPFDAHHLPHAETLGALDTRVRRLAVTSADACRQRVEAARWSPTPAERVVDDVSMVAVELNARGELTEVLLGGDAELFEVPAPSPTVTVRGVQIPDLSDLDLL